MAANGTNNLTLAPAARRWLDDGGVRYEVRTHAPTHSALAEAEADGAPPRRMVKTVALRMRRGYLAAALPASARLDMNRLRALLGGQRVRLASEEELTREFPAVALGAMHPFGDSCPRLELVDRRVLANHWVLTNGGDECHSLWMSPLDIVRLSGARVVDMARA